MAEVVGGEGLGPKRLNLGREAGQAAHLAQAAPERGQEPGNEKNTNGKYIVKIVGIFTKHIKQRTIYPIFSVLLPLINDNPYTGTCTH